jgi:hypothetical protein
MFILACIGVVSVPIALAAWRYPDFWNPRSTAMDEHPGCIDVTNVIPVPAHSDRGNGLYVNVYYANHGRLPVKRMVHRCALQYAEEPLTSAQETALMATTDGVLFSTELPDKVEIEPGDDPKHYFTCPQDDEEITALGHAFDVLTTTHRLYVAIVMKYQTEATPPEKVVVTEFCGWFNRTFDIWHNCGRNRIFTEPRSAIAPAR